MASFEDAIKQTLINEGGDKCTEIEDDAGGATKYGISLRFYKSDVDSTATASTIKNLSEAEAKRCYKKFFWDKLGLDEVRVQVIANKIFDAAVNMGLLNACRCAQRAIWTQEGKGKVLDDGKMGPLTMMALNATWLDAGKFLCSYKSELAGHYRTIAAVKTSQAKFLNGWLNRAYR